MKKFYSVPAFLVSLFLCVQSQVFALGTETTSTGLAITCIENGIRVDRFLAYSLGTSNAYVYNDSGSATPSTAGSLGVLSYRVKNLDIDITGLKEAGTTTIGIFTANGTTSIWFTDVEIEYSGTSSSSFPIVENSQFMRIGAKRSGANSATLTVKETYLLK